MPEQTITDVINDRPMDILFAEDNEADIKITLRAFDHAKIKNNIYAARDGQEVLDFIYHKGLYQDEKKYPRPDLILLDLQMSKVDGFQVLEKLKADENYNFIPVAILTSSKKDEDVVKSYREGAVSFIQKPVSYEEFKKVVDGFNFYWHSINKLPDSKLRQR